VRPFDPKTRQHAVPPVSAGASLLFRPCCPALPKTPSRIQSDGAPICGTDAHDITAVSRFPLSSLPGRPERVCSYHDLDSHTLIDFARRETTTASRNSRKHGRKLCSSSEQLQRLCKCTCLHRAALFFLLTESGSQTIQVSNFNATAPARMLTMTSQDAGEPTRRERSTLG